MSAPKATNVASISLNAGIDREKSASYTLIFFICGNPGLIGYYTTYLNTLHQLLHREAEDHSAYIHIYGQSLAGFSDDNTFPAQRPYGLEEQIQLLEKALTHKLNDPVHGRAKQFEKVILIGHSVGSYILLELIQRTRLSSSSINISAGILLFPTITYLAQSPRGIIMSRLFHWQHSPQILGNTLQRVLSLLPENVLVSLVRLVAQMPTEFAKITAGMLTSRIGIWQIL